MCVCGIYVSVMIVKVSILVPPGVNWSQSIRSHVYKNILSFKPKEINIIKFIGRIVIIENAQKGAA